MHTRRSPRSAPRPASQVRAPKTTVRPLHREDAALRPAHRAFQPGTPQAARADGRRPTIASSPNLSGPTQTSMTQIPRENPMQRETAPVSSAAGGPSHTFREISAHKRHQLLARARDNSQSSDTWHGNPGRNQRLPKSRGTPHTP